MGSKMESQVTILTKDIQQWDLHGYLDKNKGARGLLDHVYASRFQSQVMAVSRIPHNSFTVFKFTTATRNGDVVIEALYHNRPFWKRCWKSSAKTGPSTSQHIFHVDNSEEKEVEPKEENKEFIIIKELRNLTAAVERYCNSK